MKNFIARSTLWGTIQLGRRFDQLTTAERRAVLLHEAAHIQGGDAWQRFRWLLSMRIVFDCAWVLRQCRAQEFAADRYVKDLGFGPALAAFLRRFPDPGGPFHPSSKERLEALNG